MMNMGTTRLFIIEIDITRIGIRIGITGIGIIRIDITRIGIMGIGTIRIDIARMGITRSYFTKCDISLTLSGEKILLIF